MESFLNLRELLCGFVRLLSFWHEVEGVVLSVLIKVPGITFHHFSEVSILIQDFSPSVQGSSILDG